MTDRFRLISGWSLLYKPKLCKHRYGYTLLLYIQEGTMQVSKWGNSLAVRLPATVVDALDLKEGNKIEIRIAGDRTLPPRSKPDAPLSIPKIFKMARR